MYHDHECPLSAGKPECVLWGVSGGSAVEKVSCMGKPDRQQTVGRVHAQVRVHVLHVLRKCLCAFGCMCECFRWSLLLCLLWFGTFFCGFSSHWPVAKQSSSVTVNSIAFKSHAGRYLRPHLCFYFILTSVTHAGKYPFSRTSSQKNIFTFLSLSSSLIYIKIR